MALRAYLFMSLGRFITFINSTLWPNGKLIFNGAIIRDYTRLYCQTDFPDFMIAYPTENPHR